MRFARLQGNEQVLKSLAGMVDSGRVPHAIMLSEQDGGGAVEVALAFLQYLYCARHRNGDSCGECPSCNKISKLIHPDLHVIFPTRSGVTSEQYISQFRSLVMENPCFTEQDLLDALDLDGKNTLISVLEAKSLLETMSLSALEGGYRSALIYLPEKMNAEAANKLLKLIEEPPAQTQFVLITHSPQRVLQTISSRCQRIHIRAGVKVRSVAFSDPGLLDSYMSALLSRDLLSALDAADRIAALPSRESAKAFCKFASANLRDVFLVQQGLPSLASDRDKVSDWASKCKKSFSRNATAAFDRAYGLIERNVNTKIVFTDLTDRLFYLI